MQQHIVRYKENGRLPILSPKRPHYEEQEKDIKRLKSSNSHEEDNEEVDESDIKRVKPYNSNTIEEFDKGNDCHVKHRNLKTVCTYIYGILRQVLRGEQIQHCLQRNGKKITENCIDEIDTALRVQIQRC